MMRATIMPALLVRSIHPQCRARLLCLAAAGFLLAAAFLPAQLLPAQTAPAQPASPSPAPSSAPSPQAKYELQLPVPLVVEDVVILDRDGQPVHGLKASDFTVKENGKEVTLRNFEEHAARPESPAALSRPPDLGPNVFTNLPAAPPSGSLYVVLLDALNTPLADQSYVRQQMLKYLATLPPGLRVAIFGLGTRLYLLQGFTSDPGILKAALDARHGKGQKLSPLLDDPVSGEPVDKLSDSMAETMDLSDPGVAAVAANLQQFEAEQATEQTRLRVIYTLQAMDELARYLSAFPGRKNLIWFSGSFPLNIFPDDSLPNPFGAVADFQDDVRQTTDLLARSRVAVYPVDGRGLFTNPAFSASQSGASMTARIRTNPGVFGASNSKFLTQTASEHATMDSMAQATGGHAFYNTNGLKEAVETVASYGENYYTLSYTPPNQKLDGDARRIAIKCDRPGLHLEYRNAYFADDPQAQTHGKKVLPENAMTVAMMRGGPVAAQLLFDVMIVPADAPSTSLTQGTKPDARLMKPPYTSYTVQYLVDIRGATLSTDEKGVRHGALEFAAFLYNPDGELVNSVDTGLRLDLPGDRYAQLVAHGLLARLRLEAPVKGEYFLRIGVHDLPGDRVGAIEVPLAGLKSGQQLRAAAAQLNQAGAARAAPAK